MQKVNFFISSKGIIVKSQFLFSCLFICVLFFISCSKEKQQVAVTLNLRLYNASNETEWMEVWGSRNDRNGDMDLEAQGFADERFILHLQNLRDIGNVPMTAIKNVLITDGLGFHSQRIQSGFLRIVEKQPDRLLGVFEFYFQNSSLAGSSVKAQGSFQILGSR